MSIFNLELYPTVFGSRGPGSGTEALTLEHIGIILKRSAGAIKTTIQRLEKKGCLLRVAFKNGRGNGQNTRGATSHFFTSPLVGEVDALFAAGEGSNTKFIIWKLRFMR